ncbi:PREDICTED: uncharacterized protein LOC108978431 [Bactrocera latifrons]|uniref:uncharacterized protein LOC108978431 n=1 Tax=Bactrocera latifrons TaxID=174628 RepID=UPI0008DD106F|nr:PREDICTED: uncharacterized protein LOC108978431 [Bactrocera latifrons]
MKFVGVFALLLALMLAALLDCTVAADCEYRGQKANKGENFQIKGECSQYTCDGPGAISAKACPSIYAAPSCKYTPQDDSKPYPACCESYDC